MRKLSRTELWSLEQYAAEREAFRRRVIAHKQARRIALGEHATLLFEDFLTMKYQVQEMLRTERIYEPAEIQGEIDAYNPLIPDGNNWKATLLFEWDEPSERKRRLESLRGAEDRVWAEIAGCPRLFAIANEDMERSNDTKTAAVHFLRFQLDDSNIAALRGGAGVTMGIDHPELGYACTLSPENVTALLRDLSP